MKKIAVTTTFLSFFALLFLSNSPLSAYDGCGDGAPAPINAQFEEELVSLINGYRVANGGTSLLVDDGLTLAGRYLAADMIADDYFDATIQDRVNGQLVAVCTFWEMAVEFTDTAASLNIAGGYTDPQTYYNNLVANDSLGTALQSNITQIGVGYADDGTDNRRWVVVFGVGSSGDPVATPDPNIPTNTPTPTITPRPTRTSDNPINCNPTSGTGGMTPGTYDMMISGNPVTLIVGEGYDPTAPTYLGFYLHGDEGGYDYAQSNNSPINQYVNQEGWIFVAPQADQEQADYYPWHAEGVGGENIGVEDNTQQFIDTLNYVYDNYNVCRDVLFGGGASGGSWYYDVYFYPLYGGQYPAFMNLGCGSGGMSGDDSSSWKTGGYYDLADTLAEDPYIMARTEFKYSVGEDDFLFPNAELSAQTYTTLGYSVLTDFMPGVGHCGFNTAQSTVDYWDETVQVLNVVGFDGTIITPTPTQTPLPTATHTPLPTATDTPLPTATNTPTPTSTNTPLPTVTPTESAPLSIMTNRVEARQGVPVVSIMSVVLVVGAAVLLPITIKRG